MNLLRPPGRLLALLVLSRGAGAQDPRRITILYDAFGAPSQLTRDWGFAALIEYGGKRVLFDTGNDAAIFERNVKALGVDLTRLDAVVISHRHGDHTSGLTYLHSVNPNVPIHVPQEGAFFRGAIPAGFLAREEGLPPELRYYPSKAPASLSLRRVRPCERRRPRPGSRSPRCESPGSPRTDRRRGCTGSARRSPRW